MTPVRCFIFSYKGSLRVLLTDSCLLIVEVINIYIVSENLRIRLAFWAGVFLGESIRLQLLKQIILSKTLDNDNFFLSIVDKISHDLNCCSIPMV